ncbi:soluble scavenger receptor cysteine-rich domain-containing protein SSC5D-like [Erpetoichthys calabaricus]|uniref:soluble scavenger receptor cysteine-rich domain-containing protein SSC5D-like n=1 Tax=Erpetoichthys calabaricus TaxID=27687 RepID=UPI0010A0AB53|nr:soluble scavenger receptor cysteine-rich domain-containing protein SSC5D-like [Erpetoichthys calabaricus]
MLLISIALFLHGSFFRWKNIVEVGGSHVRLVRGDSCCSGTVEVYQNGMWRSICSSSWTPANSKVVCKELNCGSYFNTVKPTKQEMIEHTQGGVSCTGNENSLLNCGNFGMQVTNCSSSEVIISCQEKQSLRLVNGYSCCSGRVEINKGVQQWRTVSQKGWNRNAANAVCGEIHCGEALWTEPSWNVDFGNGDNPTWVSLECGENATELKSCKETMESNYTGNAAGVICSDVRLINGPNSCAGSLELYSKIFKRWDKVCYENLEINDACVVCKQLQCGIGASVQIGEGVKSALFVSADCNGTEEKLSMCMKKTCNIRNTVTITCSNTYSLLRTSVLLPIAGVAVILLLGIFLVFLRCQKRRQRSMSFTNQKMINLKNSEKMKVTKYYGEKENTYIDSDSEPVYANAFFPAQNTSSESIYVNYQQ